MYTGLRTHTHTNVCVCVDCEQEGRVVQTAQRAQLCGKWLLKWHHGSLSITHRTHGCFSFSLWSWKKILKSCSCGWMCPYLNSHLCCHPCSLSSSCLIYSSASSLSSCSPWFFFFTTSFLYSLPIYPLWLSFSLSLCCTVIMMLPPNDVFGLKSFWHTSSVCTLLHGGFLAALMWQRQKNADCSHFKNHIFKP